MPDQLQLRGGTTTEHNSFTGVAREVTVDTTKKTLVVHDGASAGGTALMKESGGNAASSVGIGTGGTNAINIDSSQRVGIGTSSPSSLVHFAGTAPELRLEDTDHVAYAQINAEGGNLRFDTDQGNQETNSITSFRIDGLERMRIDSSGSLLIGSTSSIGAAHKLQVFDDTDVRMIIANTTAASSQNATLFFAPANSVAGAEIKCTSEEDFSTTANRTARLTFSTRKDGTLSEQMRIDSSGNVGIGTTSMANKLEVVGTIQANVSANTASYTQAFNITNAVNADFNVHLKTNSTSIGSSTTTPLSFHTGGSANPRMTIDASGNVGIGLTTSPVNSNSEQGVFLAGADTTQSVIASNSTPLVINRVSTGGNDRDCLELRNNGILRGNIGAIGAANGMFFKTGTSEAMRIDSSGNVMVGTTSNRPAEFLLPQGFAIRADVKGQIQSTVDGNTCGFLNRNSSDGNIFNFRRQGSDVGNISVTTTATAFNTSSDYRLKENITAISDAITRLKTLKPYRFNFKSDTSKTVDGFLAHEVTAVPEAITGTKDEVDSDNNPVYQGIDQSKLVPLLVAAVQELIGKVEALEVA